MAEPQSFALQPETLQEPQNARAARRYQRTLLLAGFIAIFQVIGINFIYAIFQEFYTSPQTNIVDAEGQDALVSLVGTIGSGLTWSGGILVNPLITRIKNVNLLCMSGGIIMSLGLLLASFSTHLWHLFLTQALLWGIGSSMFYFPIMSLSPGFFDRNRGFAMGFILSGSGAGGLALGPILRVLIEKYGIRWALRILGLWNLAVVIPVALVIKKQPGVGLGDRDRTRINMDLAKRGTFIAQALGAFLQAAGNVVPMYWLTSYSSSVLLYSSTTSTLLLSINNAVNCVSRIAMGALADRIGRQNTLVTSVLLSSLCVFALWYNSRPRFIAFTVLYGIYSGGYNALLPTTIAEIYGVQNFAAVNGFIYFIRGLGVIFGSPIAGVILGSHKRGSNSDGIVNLEKRYEHVAMYDGTLLLGATLCVAYVRWIDARNKGGWFWKA